MSIQCPHCHANIDDAAVDRARNLATCSSCRRLVDLQPKVATPASAKPPMRKAVSLPAGIALSEDSAGITIRRWWRRRKHLGILAVLVVLAAFVAHRWMNAGYSVPLLLGTIVLAAWYVRLLPMLVNVTTVRVTTDRIEVRHGPLPTLLFRNQSIATSELRQLFAARWAAVYEVGAELKDGRRISLVRPLVSAEQALFVEQQLEHRLGIVDFEVTGALDSEKRFPTDVPARGGVGALALLPIVFVGVALFAFYKISSNEVGGSFTASGPRLGTFTFAPDDCTSGQKRGFFGVELSSSDSPDTLVRAVRDPVRGTLIAIERAGSKPIVLTPEECRSLHVRVDQTSTNINDVWVVEGSATVDCTELRGELTFEGCH